MLIFAWAKAGASSAVNNSACLSCSSLVLSEILCSTSRGLSPEGEGVAIPVAILLFKDATRTMKNSSRFEAKIAV